MGTMVAIFVTWPHTSIRTIQLGFGSGLGLGRGLGLGKMIRAGDKDRVMVQVRV